VNGETRQKADLNDMIWNIPETISFLSEYYRLQPGDLIFTGTPAGVGAVKKGDVLIGAIEGLGELKINIV
jgi:fumarylpyruvate hydrolase